LKYNIILYYNTIVLQLPTVFSTVHYGPGIDSASNRNEYQEYFLGVKAAGALG